MAKVITRQGAMRFRWSEDQIRTSTMYQELSINPSTNPKPDKECAVDFLTVRVYRPKPLNYQLPTQRL
ncbi:predicted protein [Sclerotinia sclerotiorum 1980 UF-70]|uniref:Uncharacterized protein n=1 Tax=Sclerotinia sclerotiorum (strain ATCC 18683 / 1980 / Ss-1) TaxID=665079 RepID=A7EMU3_SCLS1|nr:predicted protein [Sclerotinia sclerotiorum 1980 UF-70]EDO04159.1 predicted protein [Sclerotinia sclerotiorum 1980 UF-70]